ncbi:hypothetical protein LSAT2_004731 [Lamellibrachia satsuma]|nr:hypothetical protein LSAT2_004731 [Lamellibrachia satsuma]
MTMSIGYTHFAPAGAEGANKSPPASTVLAEFIPALPSQIPQSFSRCPVVCLFPLSQADPDMKAFRSNEYKTGNYRQTRRLLLAAVVASEKVRARNSPVSEAAWRLIDDGSLPLARNTDQTGQSVKDAAARNNVDDRGAEVDLTD